MKSSKDIEKQDNVDLITTPSLDYVLQKVYLGEFESCDRITSSSLLSDQGVERDIPSLYRDTQKKKIDYAVQELELETMVESIFGTYNESNKSIFRQLLQSGDVILCHSIGESVYELNYQNRDLGDLLNHTLKNIFTISESRQGVIQPKEFSGYYKKLQDISRVLAEAKSPVLRDIFTEINEWVHSSTMQEVCQIHQNLGEMVKVDPTSIEINLRYGNKSYWHNNSEIKSLDFNVIQAKDQAGNTFSQEDIKTTFRYFWRFYREYQGKYGGFIFDNYMIPHHFSRGPCEYEILDHTMSQEFTSKVTKQKKILKLLDYLAYSVSYKNVLEKNKFEHCMAKEGSSFRVTGALTPHMAVTRGTWVPAKFPFNLDKDVALIAGPNGGGKSTYLVNIGQNKLLADVGWIHCAKEVEYVSNRKVFTVFADRPQTTDSGTSRHIGHCKDIRYVLDHTKEGDLVLIDEFFTGTESKAGIELGKRVIDYITKIGAKVVISTHLHELQEHYSGHSSVDNLKVGLSYEDGMLKPNFRVVQGIAGTSYGIEMIGNILDLSGFEISNGVR